MELFLSAVEIGPLVGYILNIILVLTAVSSGGNRNDAGLDVVKMVQ
jgi:hypothetical protein